ncbi:hypothetical protein O181_120558 [Austropuccinia psidii MF-1]|uniref:Uncharacterized protein n=1 Tax=Austropuccinia psidii MF-1 TaxID=1389203 RepID=A0A9Q3KFX1_9BASI|nr:hypothetical protein [Austropuccinia psidii MF-1]
MRHVAKAFSQPQIITPLNGCCGNSSLTQVRANWPYHIIYDQLAPSISLWPQAISCHHWPSWPTLHLTNPQAITIVLGHLCPLWPLPPVGLLGPFWPNFNEAKRGQGGSPSAPKDKWAHLSPFWPQISTNPKWPKTTSGPPLSHYSAHGLWQPQEATSSAPSKDSPQFQGKNFPFSIHPILKDPGVVHIWYNIPLCTIFAQKSSSDIFRIQLHDSKSSTQSITNFEGGSFNYSVWKFPGGYQKTIQGSQPSGPAGVGLSFSHQEYFKGNSQRLSIISIIVKCHRGSTK